MYKLYTHVYILTSPCCSKAHTLAHTHTITHTLHTHARIHSWNKYSLTRVHFHCMHIPPHTHMNRLQVAVARHTNMELARTHISCAHSYKLCTHMYIRTSCCCSKTHTHITCTQTYTDSYHVGAAEISWSIPQSIIAHTHTLSLASSCTRTYKNLQKNFCRYKCMYTHLYLPVFTFSKMSWCTHVHICIYVYSPIHLCAWISSDSRVQGFGFRIRTHTYTHPSHNVAARHIHI